MLIYQKPSNIFVIGLLESYWIIYERIDLNLYADISCLVKICDYHKNIIDFIETKDYERNIILLIDHMKLLQQR